MDAHIEQSIFEDIKNFTTFTLDKKTFVQVFEESTI